MKKILAFILCFLVIGALIGCSSEPPSTPVVTISDKGVAEWSAIEDATGYEYRINDGETKSLDSSITKLQLISHETIQVRAINEHGASEWSEVQKYIGIKTLSTPKIITQQIGSQILVKWEIDPLASSYEYRLNAGAETQIDGSSFLINANDTFYIRAKGNGETTIDSNWAIVSP